jgi:hypothetical protein
MNFKTYYLSHCRVKPLQSFGSHICPQPHGLGLKEARSTLTLPMNIELRLARGSQQELKLSVPQTSGV